MQCLTVTITDDQQLEGDEQMFVIAIVDVSPEEVVEIASLNATVVRIADNNEDGKERNMASLLHA